MKRKKERKEKGEKRKEKKKINEKEEKGKKKKRREKIIKNRIEGKKLEVIGIVYSSESPIVTVYSKFSVFLGRIESIHFPSAP